MWPFDLSARLAEVTAERDVLADRAQNQDLVISQLERRIVELREAQPNGGLSVEDAWERHHRYIEAQCWREHVQNPDNLADDRPIIPSRAMRLVFGLTWELKRCSTS